MPPSGQADLEKRLDEAEATTAKQDAQLSEQAEQLSRLTQENDELRAQLEQANLALSSSRTQCSQQSGQLEVVRQELEAARAAGCRPGTGRRGLLRRQGAHRREWSWRRTAGPGHSG